MMNTVPQGSAKKKKYPDDCGSEIYLNPWRWSEATENLSNLITFVDWLYKMKLS